MLHKYFKNIHPETQGTIAFVLGLVLILGTLGKLEVLQRILNTSMIIIGLVLVFWGFNHSDGYAKIKSFLKKKK